MGSVAFVHPEVRSAFRQALLAATGIGLPTSVHWEGEVYHPVVGTPYLRETVRPIGSMVRGLGHGGTNEHMIVLGAALFYPSLEGISEIEQVAGRLVLAFAPGRSLVYGTTRAQVRQAERLRIVPEPDWQQLPVEITVSAFTAG